MMQRQIILRPKDLPERRQPLLRSSESSSSSSSSVSSRFAEVAGGTTAECAAIACCCPCGLADLAVLVVYRVPAGLCKKAIRQRRIRRLTKKGILPMRSRSVSDEDFSSGGLLDWRAKKRLKRVGSVGEGLDVEEDVDDDEVELVVQREELLELEKEMWNHFYTSGFWRSPSQKER